MDANRSILLVDDDLFIRETLDDVLSSVGYDVHTAANGKRALELIAQQGAPAVIFLDMMMPIMNGAEFLEIARGRASLAATPIVIMTASFSIRTVEGACAVLTKPFELETFLRLTETFCRPRALTVVS